MVGLRWGETCAGQVAVPSGHPPACNPQGPMRIPVPHVLDTLERRQVIEDDYRQWQYSPLAGPALLVMLVALALPIPLATPYYACQNRPREGKAKGMLKVLWPKLGFANAICSIVLSTHQNGEWSWDGLGWAGLGWEWDIDDCSVSF